MLKIAEREEVDRAERDAIQARKDRDAAVDAEDKRIAREAEARRSTELAESAVKELTAAFAATRSASTGVTGAERFCDCIRRFHAKARTTLKADLSADLVCVVVADGIGVAAALGDPNWFSNFDASGRGAASRVVARIVNDAMAPAIQGEALDCVAALEKIVLAFASAKGRWPNPGRAAVLRRCATTRQMGLQLDAHVRSPEALAFDEENREEARRRRQPEEARQRAILEERGTHMRLPGTIPTILKGPS